MKTTHKPFPHPESDLAFDEYLLRMYTHVQDMHAAHPEFDAAAVNSPYELRPLGFPPYQRGALLVHGLLDSPFIMRDIGLHLQNQGLLVRSILLPGHGTTPDDLLQVNVSEWIHSVAYGIKSLQKEVKEIYLVGYSTGGSLLLEQVLSNKNLAINGLILLCPAIDIKLRFSHFAYLHKLLSWFVPRAKWLKHCDESDYARYKSLPLNAVYQLYCLTKRLHQLARETALTTPMMMILTEDDETLNNQASYAFFRRYANPESRMLLYRRNKELSPDPRIEVRYSVFEAFKAIQLSHVSIPVAPHNPHYGMHGDDSSASHVLEGENDLYYGAINAMQEGFHRLLYKLKLKKHLVKRLTFNPDFAYLTEKVERFIKGT